MRLCVAPVVSYVQVQALKFKKKACCIWINISLLSVTWSGLEVGGGGGGGVGGSNNNYDT